MFANLFSPETVNETLRIVQGEFGLAIWETFYVTVLSTVFGLALGLPVGVILVVGEENGIRPLPKWLMSALGTAVNLLRSVPFLILLN